MNFYLTDGNERKGPYPLDQIQLFLEQDLLSVTDLIWAEDWPTWIQIWDVPGMHFTKLSRPPAKEAINDYPSASSVNPVNHVELETTVVDYTGTRELPSHQPEPLMQHLGEKKVDTHLGRPNLAKMPGRETTIATKNRINRGLLASVAVVCFLAFGLWLVGTGYKVGVKSGAQAGFKQGVSVGQQGQAEQDIDALGVAAAIKDEQDDTSATSSTYENPNPEIVTRPDGSIAPAPQTSPQYFQQ